MERTPAGCRSRWGWTAALALASIIAAQIRAAPPATSPTQPASPVATAIEGKRIADLSHAGPPPMVMPSDVAVAADGKVYVADGVNNRIIWFDNAGKYGGQIRAEQWGGLLRPMSIHIDATGRLWIGDTGHGRVVVFTPQDASEEVITPKIEGTDRIADVTDAVVTSDGATAWLVDNNGGVLIRVDVASGRSEVVGKPGGALGQFQYPFMMNVSGKGDLFVTDVINGRVQVLSSAGRPMRAIGGYGIEPAEFYRPSGLALDTQGRVWVSDGVLGVVQVFSTTGTFLGVLGQGGQPLRFDVPMGLAFDREGDLYVVELGANRVRRVRTTVHPGQPPAVQRAGGPRGPLQPQTCTACHMEWVYPLLEGKRTLYVTSFDNPVNYPHVSRAETCMSCHDGVAADSRQSIWYEKSHPIGTEVPKDMQRTDRLPLADGKMVCRTCHVAHRRPGPANIATAVYIRMRQDPSELCENCHSALDRGPVNGMHPLGDMDIAVPTVLRKGSEKTTAQRITCLVCHRPHGAQRDLLLALPGATNELCLSCHQELSPQLFTEEHRSRHGQRPKLTEAQQSLATGFGTQLGEGGTLICLTCHQAHRATSKKYLLAFNPAGTGTCAGCHTDQRSVINSSHDLRTNHAHLPNALGLTPDQAGPCSGCHGAHRYAREPVPTELDRKGWCVTCHRSGDVAEKAQLGAVNHPAAESVSCWTCHNPHTPRKGDYLVAEPVAICSQCHESMVGLRGGPHDVQRGGKAWPEQAVKAADACLACHRPHGTEQTGLFRMGLAAEGPRANAACVPCHAGAAPGAGDRQSLVHPGPATTLPAPTTLPVESEDGHVMIGCNSCHDPHRDARGGGPAAVLLRITEGGGQALCLNCHQQMVGINSIGHAAPFLQAAGFNTAGCQPCHTVHNDPKAVQGGYLYPESLLSQAKGAQTGVVADQHCVSCHREGGPVRPPRVATHPAVAMFNLGQPGQPGFLPLFNEKGRVDPNGSMSCRTCHVTHGRTKPAELGENVFSLDVRELQARQWHLRTYEQGSFCANCHGADGLYRFLYFHDPERRALGIMVGPAAPGGTPAPGAPGR